jgi:hypothetical protein
MGEEGTGLIWSSEVVLNGPFALYPHSSCSQQP